MAFKEPKRLTAEDVKKQIGLNCPDAVASSVLNLKLPFDKLDAKITEIKNTFVEIAKATGEYAKCAFDVLENDKVADQFAKNPELVKNAFVEIAKAANNGYGASRAFNALGNYEIADQFAKNPELVKNAFVEIAKAANNGEGASQAFDALEKDEIASLFAKNPELVKNAFVEIAKAAGKDAGEAFGNIEGVSNHHIVVRLFTENPNAFVEIAKAAGKDAGGAFFALEMDEVAGLFTENPNAFVEIAKAAGKDTFYAFNILEKDKFAGLFADYCNGKIKIDKLMLPIYSEDSVAIEIGRPVDDLHEKPEERKGYLSSLSNLKVFGLLISNPEYFFTSSNHIFFDRLKNDLKNESKTVSKLFEEYDLFGTEECRNFIFRAINYDRFYGRENSIFSKDEIPKILDTLLSPISSSKFDEKYYFLLANGLDSIKKINEIKGHLANKLNDRLKELQGKIRDADEEKIRSALEFLAVKIDPNTTLVSDEKKGRIKKLWEKGVFNRENYTKNGKLVIVQVFDKKDIQNPIYPKESHWIYTQRWFNKGKAQEDPGKVVVETKDTKIILFMGENKEENNDFIRQQLEETPNLIIAFRGHSFSLEKNFPYDIFGNKDSHILFIPGSCGSAGSTPAYISANKDTDLKFFSNTSTGRGQVTNAILETLMKAKEMIRFDKLLAASSDFIEKNGGDTKTIKVFGPGEMMLRYAYGTDTKL